MLLFAARDQLRGKLETNEPLALPLALALALALALPLPLPLPLPLALPLALPLPLALALTLTLTLPRHRAPSKSGLAGCPSRTRSGEIQGRYRGDTGEI